MQDHGIFFHVITMQLKTKRESERKESEEDDATKNVACRETKWSVKNNNR